MRSGMRVCQVAAMLGEAACHAECAHKALTRALLRFDAANLTPSEEVAVIVEAVAEFAVALLQLVDDYGRAEVERRRTAA